MADEYADFYADALAGLGRPAAVSHGMSGDLPDWLPPALADLYRVAGRHPLCHEHHRLLPPEELDEHAGKVVFAVENQEVVVWAFDRDDPSDDPLVWQGQPSGEWYSEEASLSRFMVGMWEWIVAG